MNHNQILSETPKRVTYKVYFKNNTTFILSLFGYNLIDTNYNSFSLKSETSCISIINHESDSKYKICIQSLFEYDITKKVKERFELYNTKNMIKLFEDHDGILNNFFKDKKENIENTPKEILERVQWYYRVDIIANTLKKEIEWSFDKINWYPVNTLKLELGNIEVICCDTDLKCSTLIDNALDLPTNRPLYHELITKAKEILGNDLKSAIMLAGIAMELGLRALFSKITGTEDNFPPIPELICKKEGDSLFEQWISGFSLSKEGKQKLLNFNLLRNDCAHQGQNNATWKKMTQYLSLIQDMLFYIDYHLDKDWAYERIREKGVFQRKFEK